MSKKNSKKAVRITDKYTTKNALINYYLLLMFTAFPLFVTFQYVNIRHDKFYFFFILSALLLALEAPIILYSFIRDKRTNPQAPMQKWYKKFSVTDIAFFAMIIVFSVSTLASDYVADSFTGNQGRFCGLLSFIIFFLVYLVISAHFSYKEYVFVWFAAASLAVYILCILNSFRIDPLGMYEGYSEKVINDFISTIGNKNVMSCFCCVTVPAFAILFIHKKSPLRFLYLAASLAGFFAMMRSDSSSGYLGFVLSFASVLLFYVRNSDKPYAGKLFWILIGLFSAIVLVGIGIFVFYTFIDTQTRLKGFMKFFRFNDKWGTHRGFMWIKSFEIFRRFNLKNMLFGCGPDTFYSAFKPFFSELNSRFGDATNNSAHNELINYLITTGIFGLGAYLTLMVSAVVRAFKAAKKNYLALVFISPVLCYLFQSVVNISTIITLPLLFIFISLAENISHKELNAS